MLGLRRCMDSMCCGTISGDIGVGLRTNRNTTSNLGERSENKPRKQWKQIDLAKDLDSWF